MATLAESFIGDLQKQNSDYRNNDSGAGWQTGIQLAQMKQQKEQQMQQLQQKQAELKMAKTEKLFSYIKDARNYQNAGDRNRYLKSAVGYRNSLGISPDELSDDQIAMYGSDENMGRIAALESAVQSGELTLNDAAAIAANAQQFSKVLPLPADAIQIGKVDWNEAQKNFLDRQAGLQKAEATQRNQNARGGQINERFDKAQKTKLADKLQSLGIPDIKVSLKELDGAVPGGMAGYKSGTPIPGISGGEAALPTNRLSGQGLAVRQAAQSVGNQILKLRSGAAVSDGEAMRTLAELGMVPTIGEGGTWTGLTWKGTTSTDAFVSGMRRAHNIVAAKEKVYSNAYGSDIYNSVTEPLKEIETPKTSGGDLTVTLGNGRTYSVKDLEKLVKTVKNKGLKTEIEMALKRAKGQ